MRYKGIIFDFDYTLGDSTKGIIQSVNYGLKRLNYTKSTDEAIISTVGLSLEKTYEELTGDNSKDKALEFEKYFMERANRIMVENTTLYDGARNTLELLKVKGLTLGIVSTKCHSTLKNIVIKNKLTNIIDFIIGSDDVEYTKPDSEGLIKMVRYMGLKKEEVLYVGDNTVDAMAAMDAKVDFVAVKTGSTKKENFSNYKTKAIIEDVNHILSQI